jgi:hypothetical protein
MPSGRKKQQRKKLPEKHLTGNLRQRIEGKKAIQEEFDGRVSTSAMWFEMPFEFEPRLKDAMAAYEAQEEERKRKEEEDAFEQKKLEEQEAFEKKRAEAAKKQEEQEKALEEKLAAKRAEAQLRPVKEVPQPKKKEKPSVARVDLQHMFHVEPEYEVVDSAQIQADLEADKQRRELCKCLRQFPSLLVGLKICLNLRTINNLVLRLNMEHVLESTLAIEGFSFFFGCGTSFTGLNCASARLAASFSSNAFSCSSCFLAASARFFSNASCSSSFFCSNASSSSLRFRSSSWAS